MTGGRRRDREGFVVGGGPSPSTCQNQGGGLWIKKRSREDQKAGGSEIPPGK